MADRGKEGMTMYQKNRLLYWILDDRGNQIGVPIKASALISRPTMKNLLSKFQANERLRQIYRARLTEVIDSFFHATDRHTRANFCHYLNSYGINPVFRENKDGRVYGITFIDDEKGAVINGSDLGKEYSGQALVKRFNVPIVPDSHRDRRTAGEKEKQEQATQGLGRLQLEPYDRSQSNRRQDTAKPFMILMKAEKGHSESRNPYLKKKKKRRKSL